MVRLPKWAVFLAVLAAACSGEDGSEATPDAGSEPDVTAPASPSVQAPRAVPGPRAICAGLSFDNVVDRAVCPRFEGVGVTPRFAHSDVICRRMAVDLLGRLPDWSEVESLCRGHSPAEMAAAMMEMPEYVRTHQRRWADRFEYNDAVTWYRYIADLDALVAELYAETIDYPTFARAALIAPGFTGRFFGEARVARAFQVFAGRDALAAERQDLSGLWAMWSVYQDTDTEYYFDYLRVVLLSALCQPPLDELICHSSLYGERTITLEARGDGGLENPANQVHLEDVRDEEWTALAAPAEVMVALPFFSEAAVERMLDRLLGWDASRALPEVVQALVALLEGEAKGSLRRVEAEIVASRLYLLDRAPPEADEEGAEPDPWTWTPLKQMDAEVWLESMQRVTGTSLGGCDHRYGFVRSGYDPATGRQKHVPHDYPVANSETGEPDRTYANIARALGGCPDHQNTFRFTGTGAIWALISEQVIQLLCYSPSSAALQPGGAFGAPVDLEREEGRRLLFTHLVRSLLTREPTDEDLADFEELAAECLAGETCEVGTLVAQTCEALAESSEFLHY